MKPTTVTWGIFDRDSTKAGTIHGSIILNQVALIEKLRSAGIPVIGTLSVEGVEYGKLSVTTDHVFGDHTWTWEPDGSFVEPEGDPAADL